MNTFTMTDNTSSIYVEFSVISYLTARPNRDIVVAGRQTTTFVR